MTLAVPSTEIVRRDVAVADRAMTLTQAAQMMRDLHAGCLVVVEGNGAGRHVAGILTDRDIVVTVVARGVNPERLRVEDVMTSPVLTARESDTPEEMIATMQRKGLRRLPVTDAAGGLVGIVALDDLLRWVSLQLQRLAHTIRGEQAHEREHRA